MPAGKCKRQTAAEGGLCEQKGAISAQNLQFCITILYNSWKDEELLPETLYSRQKNNKL